jgi:uncharacterized cupredoxin-like copper-binding protein
VRRGRGRAADAAAAVVAAVAAAYATRVALAAPPTTIEITIRHSHFDPSSIRVPAGVPVTVVLRNDDPIDHEWIVGDAATHARHRVGTEPYHAELPTEVTVPALESRTTIVTFPAVSGWTYVCHLPGHEAYGMVGTVEVSGT